MLRRSLLSIVLPAALLLTGATDPIEQIGGPRRVDEGSPSQVEREARTAAVDQAAAAGGQPAVAADQLGPAARQVQPGQQLAPRGLKARAGTSQLTSPDKGAEPPQPLTARAEGRNTAVAPVAGKDRCDGVEAGKLSDICVNVIETRAAEFVRADPTVLSPEQKLLTEQPKATENRSLDLAARRLANDGLPLNVIEQGVAATVYDARREQGEEQAKLPSEESAAAISAVLGAIAGTPGQQ